MVSTGSTSEWWTSSSQSPWWTSSSWVPNTTQDPSWTQPTSFTDLSLKSSESNSWTWSPTNPPTPAPVTSSQSSLTSTSSSPMAIVTALSEPNKTQASPTDSTSPSPNAPGASFESGRIVAMCVGTFVGLLAVGGLIAFFFFRLRRRQPNHQGLKSHSHYDDSATNTANDLGPVVRGRDRAGSFGDRMTSNRILDRSYYHARGSLSDSTTPLLQQSSSQFDSPVLERENPHLGLDLTNIHESPKFQYKYGGSYDEEVFGPLSPSPPRYSRILPMPPIVRLSRPLPQPKNPRPLVPQRRSNSIELRMQNKPPLILSSTISLDLSTSPPGSLASLPPLTSLQDTKPSPTPVPDKLPPLLPRRRPEENLNVVPSLPNSSLNLVAPFRPTPSISFKDIQHPNANNDPTTKKPKKLRLRRNQPNARPNALTSESFRCAGEKAMDDEDDGAYEGDSSPSAYSQLSATGTTEARMLLDT